MAFFIIYKTVSFHHYEKLLTDPPKIFITWSHITTHKHLPKNIVECSYLSNMYRKNVKAERAHLNVRWELLSYFFEYSFLQLVCQLVYAAWKLCTFIVISSLKFLSSRTLKNAVSICVMILASLLYILAMCSRFN